jgi:hypothetical protein
LGVIETRTFRDRAGIDPPRDGCRNEPRIPLKYSIAVNLDRRPSFVSI